ncbi:hypothetical protein FBU30_008258 [Linnemannia zychae]|nr:hypothetical protein FBU30_008258 [Linnemannia zychae]
MLKSNQEAWFDDLGWHFNTEDDFIDKDGNLFDFKTQSDYYEFLHDKIQDMLSERLIKEYKFQKIPVPWVSSATDSNNKNSSKSKVSVSPDCPQVYATPDILVNPKVLIIVQGLGKVAPGQWARKLFTNGQKGNFNFASQFPYIERARHLGWAIILCDPNRNEISPSSESGPMSMWLRGGAGVGRTRADHVRRVWEDLIRQEPSKAKCVMFVAFSAGTWATLELFDTYREDFMKRVKAVALLDGATGSDRYQERDGAWLFKNTWSFTQMGVGLLENGSEVDTDDHDSVPGAAVEGVFAFLEERHNLYMARLPPKRYDYLCGLYRKDLTKRRHPRHHKRR